MIKILPRTLLLTSIILCFAACSHRDMYHAVQDDKLRQCQEALDQPRERCMNAHQMSYEEYEAERRKLLDPPPHG